MAKEKIYIMCSVCKSHNIVREAITAWSVESQDWQLVDTMDIFNCEDCNKEVEPIFYEE
jgi:hypothetical protein